MTPDKAHAAPAPAAAASEADKDAATVATHSFSTVQQLWDYRVRTTPDAAAIEVPRSPAAATPELDPEQCFDSYTFRQIDDVASRLSRAYAASIARRGLGQEPIVVGFIVNASLDILVAQIAILKLGHVSAFFSPNSSAAALAHLVKSTAAPFLFHDVDHAAVAHEAAAQLCARGGASPVVGPQINLGALKSAGSEPIDGHGGAAPNVTVDSGDCLMIMHSSGSTGLPKPLRLSHASQMALFTAERFPDLFHMLPLFHHFGQICLWRCIASGRKATLTHGILNAAELTAMMKASSAHGSAWFIGVPLLVKMLAEHVDAVRELARFDRVILGGSACPTEIGEALVDRGVRLVVIYGASEFGSFANSARDFERERDWDFLRLYPAAIPFARFQRVNDAVQAGQEPLYELCIDAGWPALADVALQDGVYRTKDLFSPHSIKPHTWRYVGRRDDTLVHFNGEKTNPLPIESVIRSSPLVADCIVFGAGRALAGVLIIPSESALGEVGGDGATGGEARKRALWHAVLPVVERANRQAPSHSRIVPEMVRVLSPCSRFPRADKGSLIRAQTVIAYRDEIERAYDDYEHGRTPGQEEEAVEIADIDEALTFVVETVLEPILKLPDGAAALDADLVELGMDSLAAARIKNRLQQAGMSGAPLPSNVAFNYPTARKLAHYILKRRQALSGDDSPEEADGARDRDQAELLEATRLAANYSAQILPRQATDPVIEASRPPALGSVVVLTGATGSLGAHLVHQLSRRRGVTRIVCLIRAASDAEAQRRLDDSLALRKLPSIAALRQRGADAQIECLAADLARDRLGLAREAYDALVASADTVLHVGWPVNFNMSLGSFESSIKGALNLLNLATQSRAGSGPARYLFASSISAAMGAETGTILEAISDDPRCAVPMGYARSKWVVEQLCRHASVSVGGGFEALVLRIGQLVGDTVQGVWNETEAVPLMVRTAKTMGCLPDLRGQRVCWIGVDVAARVIARLATAVPAARSGQQGEPSSRAELVHVVNPVPTRYDDIFAALARPENLGATFELVAPEEWVKRLEATSVDQSVDANPTLKLLDHYRAMWGASRTKRSGGDEAYAFQTDNLERLLTAADSRRDGAEEARRDLGGGGEDQEPAFGPVDERHVAKMVSAWKERGFL
ncbi:uncharacterized protein PFL1_06135 [Pseudozyma flocculosa PF-1]|uniref:Related to LYS2 \|nr:uncharacterized protein PFL1_06135 [Pseudozyma flocculosa PF-1]EPQ26199.1 hypothetical protein PFL1_06135 [Pseudozyma flocculosa PF-1]SPO40152.1 related to LYS2 \